MAIRTLLAAIAAAVLIWGLVGCGDKSRDPANDVVSSRAYKGHADDQDMNHLVAAYPGIAGTRLDDCQSCHTGGNITSRGKIRYKNACDFCHCIPFPEEDAAGLPATYEETLNPFGRAYKNAGGNKEAILAIGKLDSDKDGFPNEEEILDGRYPGSPNSKPGQPKAPTKILDLAALRSLPAYSEFLLVNSHQLPYDFYATYEGVRIQDLLSAVGVHPEESTGITVFSADGYTRDFDFEAISTPYPHSIFYSGLDTVTMGAECGFVNYPSVLPRGLVNGGEIHNELWLMLAYERDGEPLDGSYLDPATGKIEGVGPLYIIVPQSTPGEPDRGPAYSPSGCEDGHDYNDANDHNAGSMVRGIVAIRVNPMPEGYEEFDYMNGGWAYVDAGELIVYGLGVE